MQYLAWRVLVGLNKKITLSFLIVGHTKFSPDWCFGLFKQTYRRTKIGCLDDIVRVVESSAVVNHAQLVGTQDVQVIVPTYDWASFFDKPFRQKALTGIKSMHHLTFTSNSPGKAVVKDSVTTPERSTYSKIRAGSPHLQTFHLSSNHQDFHSSDVNTCSSTVLPSRLLGPSLSRSEAGRTGRRASTT